jgi:hypothetical protein
MNFRQILRKNLALGGCKKFGENATFRSRDSHKYKINLSKAEREQYQKLLLD